MIDLEKTCNFCGKDGTEMLFLYSHECPERERVFAEMSDRLSREMEADDLYDFLRAKLILGEIDTAPTRKEIYEAYGLE